MSIKQSPGSCHAHSAATARSYRCRNSSAKANLRWLCPINPGSCHRASDGQCRHIVAFALNLVLRLQLVDCHRLLYSDIPLSSSGKPQPSALVIKVARSGCHLHSVHHLPRHILGNHQVRPPSQALSQACGATCLNSNDRLCELLNF